MDFIINTIKNLINKDLYNKKLILPFINFVDLITY